MAAGLQLPVQRRPKGNQEQVLGQGVDHENVSQFILKLASVLGPSSKFIVYHDFFAT